MKALTYMCKHIDEETAKHWGIPQSIDCDSTWRILEQCSNNEKQFFWKTFSKTHA